MTSLWIFPVPGGDSCETVMAYFANPPPLASLRILEIQRILKDTFDRRYADRAGFMRQKVRILPTVHLVLVYSLLCLSRVTQEVPYGSI